MDPQPASAHALVLAAGEASRFGSPKQLVRVQGRPLLHRVVSQAVEVAGHDVTVVLGAYAEELAPLLRHSPVSVVVNRDWREGIASSIRTGLAHLPPSCSGLLLMLADQALVGAGDLRRLLEAWRRQLDCIVAAQYEATTGPPAIFPREDFPALTALRGDQGARALLRGRSPRVMRVPMPTAAVDIDTPEDLLRL